MLVVVEHVSKSYENNAVLRDVSLSLEAGKIHGIIGRNGSGKSQLLKIICGFIPPDSGCVKVNHQWVGRDVDFPEDSGILIETPGFCPSMSGYQNLRLLAGIRGKCTPERIAKVMQQVGLDPSARKHVSKYSSGMNQRLGIAQAILEDPTFLVFDEPMNCLDVDGVEEMRRLFMGLRERGKTILLTSHNAEDIDLLCDTVHRMEKGTLVS